MTAPRATTKRYMVSLNFVAGLQLSHAGYTKDQSTSGVNLLVPSKTLNKLFIKLQIVYMAYAIQLTMIIQFSPNMCVFGY